MTHKKTVEQRTRLETHQLKRVIDIDDFEFETTAELPQLTSIVGQERGTSVMKFGLNVHQEGYNLYVSGPVGTGKTSFTKSIVNELAEEKVIIYDWCYVHNFDDGYKPKIIQFERGNGKEFQEKMKQLLEELKQDIPLTFEDDSYLQQRENILKKLEDVQNRVTKEVSELAAKYDFAIQETKGGVITIPLYEGEAMSREQYQSLSSEDVKEIEERTSVLQEEIINVTKDVREVEKKTTEALNRLHQNIALEVVKRPIDHLKQQYKHNDAVVQYLEAVQTDIVTHVDHFLEAEVETEMQVLEDMLQGQDREDIFKKYEVNVLVDNRKTQGAPVVVADNPTYYNLVGKVEYESRMGVMSTDFRKVKPGYLHHANGGYLIIQAKDIFSKSFAWEGLKRALLNNKLQIENLGEQSGLVATTSINPEPIPLDVKVILIGNMDIYQVLYNYDEDFTKLFKIRADFDTEMNLTARNIEHLASFIHTHCQQHELCHFHREAVMKIVEYSIRLAGHQNKLSTQFNHLVEIIYEASTWARIKKAEIVRAEHVVKAIREREYRSGLFEEKIQENIEEGTILIDTEGEKIGQVNGLAVYHLGQHRFGKPSRITATTFVGRKGIINIERESKMGGNIHNKGVYILSGFLGEKFAQTHALALTANLAFEQSYGGVDGDSASSTELYALLSSLAKLPIRQGLAVTGSINQKGEIQPIGGVNEKIEGFFNVCKSKGLTGEQGVLIPHQNMRNLMLKDEVIQAVEEGKFHIYAVKTIEEGIELLTGVQAEKQDAKGQYGKQTVFGKVIRQLEKYAEVSIEK